MNRPKGEPIPLEASGRGTRASLPASYHQGADGGIGALLGRERGQRGAVMSRDVNVTGGSSGAFEAWPREYVSEARFPVASSGGRQPDHVRHRSCCSSVDRYAVQERPGRTRCLDMCETAQDSGEIAPRTPLRCRTRYRGWILPAADRDGPCPAPTRFGRSG